MKSDFFYHFNIGALYKGAYGALLDDRLSKFETPGFWSLGDAKENRTFESWGEPAPVGPRKFQAGEG